jgi:hypothetical protein
LFLNIFFQNQPHQAANYSLFIDLNHLLPIRHCENKLANAMDQLDNAVNNVGHDPHNQLVNVLGV